MSSSISKSSGSKSYFDTLRLKAEISLTKGKSTKAVSLRIIPKVTIYQTGFLAAMFRGIVPPKSVKTKASTKITTINAKYPQTVRPSGV
ncbi:MAG: hypothetical protein LUC92_05680 [Clostridiales bacterium]|nr:hypothetical protein [Clostridiales bacterium]